jgi:hypothetical protein
VVFVLWLAIQAVFIAAAFMGFRPAAIGFAAVITFWLGQSFLAARAARREPAAPRRWHSRPMGLVALYLASTLATTVGAARPVRCSREGSLCRVRRTSRLSGISRGLHA